MPKIPDLFEACIFGDEYLLKQVIERGERLNRKFRGLKPLRWAVQEGHLKIVKLLIQNGADPEEPDEEGHTPLYVAVGEEHQDIIRYFFKLGVDINRITKSGTALQLACAYGIYEIVKMLIDAGADVKTKDAKGRTARSFAKRYGHSEIVTLIDDIIKRRHAASGKRSS